MCAPIILGVPVGFVYLEHGDALDHAASEHVDTFAAQLGLFAERFDHLFARRTLADEVRLLQRRRVLESIERNRGNLTAAARELGMSRTFVNRVVRDR